MTKHILIVGYGSAALAVLKALQDLPEEFRRGWRISVFERRHGIGGQWCALPYWFRERAECMLQAAR